MTTVASKKTNEKRLRADWVWLTFVSSIFVAARRQEIIKMTEQLIEAINNGDFDAYTWVF